MTFPDTRFTATVGCRLPIQQAGMGAVSTPSLAAAVARAGGLGMIGAAGLDRDQLAGQLTAAAAAAGPVPRVGTNFLLPFLDIAALEVAAAHSVLVECFYGDPDRGIVERIHDGAALAGWQVGSRDEALAAEAAGCDVIVVQGFEAGGHVRGTTPLDALLDAVRPGTDLPIVAAGGIGSGTSAAAAFRAGADAVRVGTCLLATPEADVHPDYARALLRGTAADTIVTETFSLGWPNAPHRVLRACIDASDAAPSARSPLPPTRGFTGSVDQAALYAGTSVDEVHEIQPAEAVVRRLAAETAAALS